MRILAPLVELVRARKHRRPYRHRQAGPARNPGATYAPERQLGIDRGRPIDRHYIESFLGSAS
jgi:hypothetical protein